VEYECTGGRVLDTFTNRRSFMLACGEEGEYEVPRAWPTCVPATHCVGPARQPEPGAGVYLAVPRRHARVNTEVAYLCKKDPAHRLQASCFADGRYRYSASWPSCDYTPAPPTCSADPALGNSTSLLIPLPPLASGSHGWLAPPPSPAPSCSWLLTCPPDHRIALGVLRAEGKTRTEEKEEEEPTPCLELTEVGRPGLGVTEAELGTTWVSWTSSVRVRSTCAQHRGWHLAYLVIQP